MPNPTIAAGYPKAFLDFAVSKGADRQTLLDRSGIPPADLSDLDKRIPLGNYVELIKAGIELCREPALSLLFGEAVNVQKLSIAGLMGGAFSFDSIESARQQIDRYSPLALDTDDAAANAIEFVRENGDVALKFTWKVYVDYPLLTEAACARTICGVRQMQAAVPELAKMTFPKAIHFTHKEPDYRAEYDRIFGVPIVFESHMNAIVVGEEFLSIRLQNTNPYLSKILKTHADELLKNLENSKSTRGRVESLLLPILHTGDVSIATITRKLGVSRQTLFRKLKAEGVSFEQVLDELRHTLALRYLKEKKSVTETAYLVGFSNPTAFSRAFKRWTGSRPRAIRNGE
jgi:AraC-like DNA-binding protein